MQRNIYTAAARSELRGNFSAAQAAEIPFAQKVRAALIDAFQRFIDHELVQQVLLRI